jgi:hypothetical protein
MGWGRAGFRALSIVCAPQSPHGTPPSHRHSPSPAAAGGEPVAPAAASRWAALTSRAP